MDKTDEETFQDVKNILVPSTSDVLYGLIDGSVVSSTWNTLTGKTDQLFSYVLRRTGDSVGGTLGDFLNYLGEGATYVCYSGGKQVAYSTATKYPHYRRRHRHRPFCRRQGHQPDAPALAGGHR